MDNTNTNSKMKNFFEWGFALFVVNFFTIFSVVLLIPGFAGICAMFRSIKEFLTSGATSPFKKYFGYFWHYFKRRWGIGLINLFVIFALVISIYVYGFLMNPEFVISQVGFWGSIVLSILFLLIVPQIVYVCVYYDHIILIDVYKFAIYITFRFLFQTIINFVCYVIGISLVVILPIWVCFGISIPALVSVKLTYPLYYSILKLMEKELEKDE
ncbi:MAG: hypothetical protein IJD76_04370 [Bacilli bacterium]|nr:hypothetical protein [Bacilli bacterium]